MTATATTATKELLLAQEIIGLSKKGDFRGALARALKGARQYPTFTIPAAEGKPEPTFEELAAWLRSKLPAEAEAEVATPAAEPARRPAAPKKTAAAPAARKAAPKKTAPARKAAPVAPVAQPAPVAVEPTVLRLVHDGVDQTSIFGVEKDSPAHLAIGSAKRGGLGWMYFGAKDCFYLRRSAGYAPDMEKINEAIGALSALTEGGRPLYRVETDIRTTDASGAPLKVRMTAAQAAAWQRDYDTARNVLWANMGMGLGVCGKCGAGDLNQRTGRIGKGDDGLPMVECATCGGFGAPAPAPAAAPAVSVSPLSDLYEQRVEHYRARGEDYGTAAAWAKADVQAERPAPVAAAAPVIDLSSLLALPAEPAAAPANAEECPSCRQLTDVVDGKFVLHSRPFSGAACRGKVGVPVQDVEPEAAPTPVRKAAARPAAAPAAPVTEPEADDEPEADELVWKFAIQGGLSGSQRNATATEVRQAISKKITWGRAFRGVKIETRRDKVNHRLVLSVVDGSADGYDAAELADAVAAAVKSVRGVGNRVHK